MRVLITGGAGFIGSHLVDYYLKEKQEVIVIDNLSTGSIHNIEHHLLNTSFHFIERPVEEYQLTKEAIYNCDIVFHLAAAVGVRNIVENPTKSILTNLEASKAIFANATSFEKRILFTSTSEVYGKSDKLPFSEEDDSIIGPSSKSRWGYAASKLVDEFMAMAYAQDYGLNVVIVRLFNTVGPRQTGKYGMVLPRFIQQALNNEPLTVYGGGLQTRCFCSVYDIVSALIGLADSGLTGVYNVGSKEETAIVRLAEKVIKLSGSSSEINFIPFEEAYSARGFDDIQFRVPNTAKIEKALGWKPTQSLDAIIRNLIEYEKMH